MGSQRIVGDYELLFNADMNMYRIMNSATEEFSAWFSAEEAEELKSMERDEFFVRAEKSLKDARDSAHEQTGDTKTEL
ncbi:hypothetical protein GCM10007103_12810 [Salinimicrobium marinum]|uniref:Uncharacterized protein n=1 Tax=Salinimicrobium marinum TaxID=680283 RepID=A0A918SC50_9FLAO|nr:hypothetical protein [Salinimicrobium marinum]GHA32801.1 hypothetical protein GCM10007103_12810 [Salinimicrobium marinum]